MLPVFNLYVKFDANIFISDRYMAILLLRWEGFLGCLTLNVVGYRWDPKRLSLGRKHAF